MDTVLKNERCLKEKCHLYIDNNYLSNENHYYDYTLFIRMTMDREIRSIEIKNKYRFSEVKLC